MRDWKRLAALTLTAVLCISLLAGCAKDSEGLSLAVCVGAYPETLDPIYARSEGDQTILSHLYENLMRVASDGAGGTAVVNGMAKSVDTEKNLDGTVTYTFRLRGAKWSDGRAVKAGDFVYAWQRLADPATGSPWASLLSVVSGYDDARATGDMDLLGVTAKNDSTLQVVLDGYYDWFLTQVCTSPVTVPLRQDVVQRLKEDGAQTGARWWSDPTRLVTNGAYQAESYDETALTLRLSDRYYSDQPGPSALTFRFADTAEQAWQLYSSREVDAVWPLPQQQLEELAAQEGWTAIPTLSICGVVFNCNAAVLEDPMVRQAFIQAIDRTAVAAAAGVGAAAAEGLVPPCVPEGESTFREVGGALLDNDPETYAQRCETAQTLLTDAGYDSGSNLGEVELLYSIEEPGADKTAQLLGRQWQEVLGVRVTPRGVTAQDFRSALQGGGFTLALTCFTAEGNDAECFLDDWTTHSPDNIAGYANSAYDTLMAVIAKAEDGTARMGCLHDAEQLLLSDGVVAPLYTAGTAWQVRDTLTGAFRDARGWFGFGGTVTRPS